MSEEQIVKDYINTFFPNNYTDTDIDELTCIFSDGLNDYIAECLTLLNERTKV